ncbi:uncharacterized protein LOC119396079 [Rhipicephalus sanguineus]|uniref:uncharacterized protein LOC119396079 n=1 Tax=Rhipicephalus sanguineus TaxID=34632 RepID=UPI0018945B21|nr:uncharacterized protein LOC119396079 [Rhipicephalus sanguineus]
MSRGDELETVKAVIRALLIARKRPMPLRRFLLTFIESEGHVLPYARFGFSDPLSFLRSIPDAAQVSQLGSDVYVRATVTDDIEHVRRLVRGQREPNFKSMRLPPAYKRPDLFPPVQSMAFSPSSLQNFSTPRYTGALDPVKANLGKGSAGAPPVLPPVRPAPYFTGQHTTGQHPLPDQRALKPLHQFVRTAHSWQPIHADVDLRMPQLSTGQSFHPYTLPTSIGLQQQSFQVGHTVQPLNREIQYTGAVTKIWRPNRSRLTSHSFHPDIKSAGMEPSCQTGATELSGAQKVATQRSCQSRLNAPLDSEDDEPSSDVYSLMRQQKITRQNPERYEALCRMNPQVEKNIRKVLRRRPEGIWLSDLVKVYKEITGADLCPVEYGYNSVWDLILDFRHLVSVTNPRHDGNCMIGPHENPTTPTLSSWTVNVLRLLLRLSGPQGLTVLQLLQAFQKVTGKTIDLEKCGLSTHAFVTLLATGSYLTFEDLGEGQFLLKSQLPKGTRETVPMEVVGPTRPPEKNKSARADQAPTANETTQVKKCAPLTSTLKAMSGIEALKNSDIAEYVEIAENTGSPDSSEVDELEQMIMTALTSPNMGRVKSPPLFMANNPYARPDHLEVGKHYAVYVSQIYSVHHFYIQKKGLDASVRLEALMNQLDLVYNGPESSAYLIDDKLVHVGMPCAASYTYSEGNSDWHRGLVVGLDADPSICQVLFIDYGTLTFLKKTEVRFLRNDFFDLPPQAVRATMEYLKPVTPDGWTLETKTAFIELASGDKTLVCKVLKRRGALHSVSLCITSHNSEEYVSDLLVERRLALPTLKYKETIARMMEAGPCSTDRKVNVPGTPPSLNSGSDITSKQPTAVVHPSQHWGFVADQSMRTGLGPQPADVRLRAQDSLPFHQAEPSAQTSASASQATKPAQPLDEECAHAPALKQAQQKGHVQSTLPKDLPSVPHTNGVQMPTPQYSEQVPDEHVIPCQPNTNYYLSCQEIPPLKDWQEPFEQEQRLARCHASSTVKPCAESAQITMQSAVQIDVHSRGEPASEPVHDPEPVAASTVHRYLQSAVRDTAQPGGESAVQSTPSLAVQPQFQGPVQPPLKPAMAIPGVPPSQFQTPLATERMTNQPSHEAVDDEVDILDLLREELDGRRPSRAVKPEHLTSGYCLMVVNCEGVPYVTTANVCQLLGWPSDVILQRLEAKCIQFPTLVLKRDSNNYWIFNEMASCDVPGVKFEHSQPQEVTLIPLRNVLDLLNLFEFTEAKLRHDIVAVLYSFNPRSSYWHLSDAVEEGDVEHQSSSAMQGRAETPSRRETPFVDDDCYLDTL